MVFFPYVMLDGLPCKYGVIALEDLLRDLRTWDTMYCSGRLHKPVKVLASTEAVDAAMADNLRAALGVALLVLHPSEPSEVALYMTIAGLSYEGDVRMGLAEDRNKVRSIVENNVAGFRSLYAAPIRELEDQSIVQKRPDGSLALVAEAALRARTRAHFSSRERLAEVVRRTSLAQTAKGIVSAGPCRSLTYAMRKLGKRWSP